MTERQERPLRATPRHLARIFVLLGLYQWLSDRSLRFADIEGHLEELLKDEEGAQIEECEITPEDCERYDRKLFKELLSGVLMRAEETERTFAAFVDRDMSRVTMVEHAVLFLGTYELTACPETPWRVVLNESVELAKAFGGGYRFTNAVLERVAHAVRPEETGNARP